MTDEHDTGSPEPVSLLLEMQSPPTPQDWWSVTEPDLDQVVPLKDFVARLTPHVGTLALARWWIRLAADMGDLQEVYFREGFIYDDDTSVSGGTPEPLNKVNSPQDAWWKECRIWSIYRSAPEPVVFDAFNDSIEYVIEVDDAKRWRCFVSGLGFSRRWVDYYCDESGRVPAPEAGTRRSPGRPQQWDWEGAYIALIARANTPDGLKPDGDIRQADIVRLLQEHFHYTVGNEPAKSTCEAYAKKIIDALNKIPAR